MPALTKQPINLNFAGKMDTKSDPWQLDIGNFILLQNTVFDDEKNLLKRNGFGSLTLLPSGSTASQLTTHKDTLVAIESSLLTYSVESDSWQNRGFIKPIDLSVVPLVRTTRGQTTVDTAVSTTGLVCTVFLDGDGTNKYSVASATTGQSITGVVSLASGATDPRVFCLGRYFIITYKRTITATPNLCYIAIPLSASTSPGTETSLSTTLRSTAASGYDGVVANDVFYFAYDGSAGGGEIKRSKLSATLVQTTAVATAGRQADLVSVCADESGSTPVIYITYYTNSDSKGYTISCNQNLTAILSATNTILNAPTPAVEVTSVAQNAILSIFYQVSNNYTYVGTRSDYIRTVNVTAAGSVGSASNILRSVGLGSKAFLMDGVAYMLGTYSGALQPSYFLINSSGQVISRLAYSNGAGYATTQVVPSVSIQGNVAYVGYLIKDFLAPVNKTQGVTNVNGVYSQTGINLASFDFSLSNFSSAEIGGSLHTSGGMLWQYDGTVPVEHGFNLFPEDILVATNATAGSAAHQQYYYQVTYEWTDGQGNIHRSAPSLPMGFNLVANNSMKLDIPTLRLTYKSTASNKVRIVIYRWSTAQPNYYRVNSITTPLQNDTTADSVSYIDSVADSSILGNDLLYTTGGVVENIASPAVAATTLFDDRLWLIDAEDRNLLWYSKQVIEATPVELSDLFTLYIAPSTGAEGSTGDMLAHAPMDDKLVLFKASAAYYINGSGPNNLGTNSSYSSPTFITATVGCSNQASIVFTPRGLMFQASNGQGIWLLGRDLSTQYIGVDVEAYAADAEVLSAIAVPGTTQVRFTMSSGYQLMYDYYYGKWGVFQGIPAISSTVVNGLHTFLNSNSEIFQETPGEYVDGSTPVKMKFTTGWINPAGLQGYQRAYFLYILANYVSPHKLQVEIGYDYNSSPSQSSLITPTNYAPTYGEEDSGDYGQGAAYGGPGAVEQWRVFLKRQRCQAFQITISEQFDPSYDTAAGQGLSISGMNLVVGLKKGFTPIPASQSVG